MGRNWAGDGGFWVVGFTAWEFGALHFSFSDVEDGCFVMGRFGSLSLFFLLCLFVC